MKNLEELGLEHVAKELKPIENAFIIRLIPPFKKKQELEIREPNEKATIEDWAHYTDFHPLIGLVVSASKELEDIAKPGRFVYLSRKNVLQPILHRGKIFYRAYKNDIAAVVENIDLTSEENADTESDS